MAAAEQLPRRPRQRRRRGAVRSAAEPARPRVHRARAACAAGRAKGWRSTCWVEPARYDPIPLLPDPRLRARVEALDPIDRAALAETLAGNVSAHIVYCVRADERMERADFMAADAVPVLRELSGPELAGGIQPDGTITVVFDGLRLPIALPPLAPAILRLVDGRRSVGEIAAELAQRGTGAEAFERGWRATFGALERINRLLLAAPIG